MNSFKTWIQNRENTWWVCRSSLPNDTRPSRILGVFDSEEEAQTFIMQLWRMK